MSNRLYALHVGINAYQPPVRALQGCVPDVERLQAWLRGHFDPAVLALETLTDAQATRANVIDAFRRHLGQAGPDDVALFHFSGHGAQSKSAAAFRPFFPEGLDEGLVCADSRLPGGHDLADKELAALLQELAPRQAHVAVLFDCCHSGSGTRAADAFDGLVPRMTGPVTDERPLETYLGGHYAKLQTSGQPLAIPSVRHILLAACERGQLAQERLAGAGSDPGGIFTSTLLEVLQASGGALSYAELFVRCRAAVRKRARDQNPQFEAAARFDARSGFLGQTLRRQGRRFSVHFDKGRWQAACGAVHGLPVDSAQPVALTLYPEDQPGRSAGTATAVQIGAQHSALALDFESPESARFQAELSSLPVPPMLLGFDGSAADRQRVQQTLDEDLSAPVQLVDDGAAPYMLTRASGRLALQRAGEGAVRAGLAPLTLAWTDLPDAAALPAAAQALQPTLQAVQQWERLRALANPRTKMDPSLVDFELSEPQPDGSSFVHPVRDVTLTSVRQGSDWRECRLRLRVRNRSAQPLHFLLLNLSPHWGVHRLANEPLAPQGGWMTLYGEGADEYFYVDEGRDEVIERFQLVVATEPMDDFLLTQDDLVPDTQVVPDVGDAGTRGLGSVRPRRVHSNEWFTLPCQVRVVRQLAQVGAADASVAQGQITVRRHSRVRAEIALGAARAGATRSLGPAADFYQAFEARGLQMLDFSGGTRSDADQSVLTLSDLRGADALADEPLEIVIHTPLGEDEGLLPLVYDGQHVLLGGAPSRQDDGSTLVSIRHVPDGDTQGRSLGGALKMYFFKTVLRRAVNRLRWVGFDADGQPQQHDDGVAAKVASAQRVLLLVHGIIGDTAGIAAGLRGCGLDQRFDLVLSYDYENLDTPIEETARRLGAALKGDGLHADDGKQLTLLVHSMGGLVSRWFIEREGGAAVVDHLVMCGTPNGGSPFGRIDDARKIFSLLTSLTLNYIPVLIPFASALLLALNRSKALTGTLEQMHPGSPFIESLNSSPDPGVRYTIVAGDVNAYEEPGDALFAKLLAKVGQSLAFDLLFANRPNDIAVGVPSILSAGAGRRQAPRQFEVACHHMNYFVSDAGRAALRAVAWD